MGENENVTKTIEQPAVNVAEVERKAVENERARVSAIRAVCEKHNCRDMVDTFINGGYTVEAVNAAVLDELAKRSVPVATAKPTVTIIADEKEKFRNAAADAILLRSGNTVENAAAGAEELRGFSIRDMAREVLRQNGKNGMMSSMEALELVLFYNRKKITHRQTAITDKKSDEYKHKKVFVDRLKEEIKWLEDNIAKLQSNTESEEAIKTDTMAGLSEEDKQILDDIEVDNAQIDEELKHYEAQLANSAEHSYDYEQAKDQIQFLKSQKATNDKQKKEIMDKAAAYKAPERKAKSRKVGSRNLYGKKADAIAAAEKMLEEDKKQGKAKADATVKDTYTVAKTKFGYQVKKRAYRQKTLDGKDAVDKTAAQKKVDEVNKKLTKKKNKSGKKVRVELVEDQSQVQGFVQSLRRNVFTGIVEKVGTFIEGATEDNDGEIVVKIVRNNIDSMDRLDEVIAHELLHAGLRYVLNKAQRSYILHEVNRLIDSDKAFAEKVMPTISDYVGAGRNVQLEEVLARLAETIDEESPNTVKRIWNKIVSTVYKALRRLGLTTNLHKSELTDIIKGLRNDLTQPGSTFHYTKGMMGNQTSAKAMFRADNMRKALDELSKGEELFTYDINDGKPLASLKTWDEGGRAALVKYLQKAFKAGEISRKDADDLVKTMDDIADTCRIMAYDAPDSEFGKWSQVGVDYDSQGKPYFTVVRQNGDYAMNIDFSTVCKKRRALNNVLNEIVKRGYLTEHGDLTQKDVVDIQEAIKNHGFEVACALCFVDSKRYNIGKQAKNIVDKWNKMYKSFVEGTDFYKEHLEKALARLADGKKAKNQEQRIALAINSDEKDADGNYKYRRELTADWLISSGSREMIGGHDNLAKNYPRIFEVLNGYGSGKSKNSHMDVAWNNDIINAFAATNNPNVTNFDPVKAKSIGGVRIQSFSDFIPTMFFDYVQCISELAAKKLTAHCYTKEADFVKLFGSCGIKTNMSLVYANKGCQKISKAEYDRIRKEKGDAFVTTISDNGKTVYYEYLYTDLDPEHPQSFNPTEAFRLREDPRYADSCGTIAVAVSEEHLKVLLADPRIDMVIPYHKSGISKEVAAMRNINEYVDFTKKQTERDNITGYLLNDKVDEHKAALKKSGAYGKHFDFYGDLENTKDPRQTANNYLAWCKDNNLTPKFNDYTSNQNYYKLLADFKLYKQDSEGNEVYVPQKEVKLNLNKDYQQVLSNALDVNQKIADKFAGDIDNLLETCKQILDTNLAESKAKKSAKKKTKGKAVIKFNQKKETYKVAGNIDKTKVKPSRAKLFKTNKKSGVVTLKNNIMLSLRSLEEINSAYKNGSEEARELFDLRRKYFLEKYDNPKEYFRKMVPLWEKHNDKAIDKDNFFRNTYANFVKRSRRPNREPDFVSRSRYNGKVSSEYWYTDKGVIRGSKHWGQGIRTCDWFLDNNIKGDIYHTDKVYAFCPWSDFVFKSDIDIIDGKMTVVGHYEPSRMFSIKSTVAERLRSDLLNAIPDNSDLREKYRDGSTKNYPDQLKMYDYITAEGENIADIDSLLESRQSSPESQYTLNKMAKQFAAAFPGKVGRMLAENCQIIRKSLQKDGISKKKINAVTVDDIINSPVQNIFGYGSYAETEGEQKFENYTESNRAYAESQKAAAEEGRQMYDENLKKYQSLDSLMKDVEAEHVRFSLKSTESDQEYLDAVNSGDMETAQQMVDEAAKAAGYKIVAYHGTEAQFNVFDRTKSRSNMDIQGNFFSPWEDDAKGYGRNVRKFYIKLNNPATFGQGLKALKMFRGLNKAGEKAANYLIKKGYDGVNNDDEEYIVFDSENIKSADPITKDDSSKLIPLSQRFNAGKKDVRYSFKVYGKEAKKLASTVNEKNRTFKHGNPLDFVFTDAYFYVYNNPYYEENIAYDYSQVEVLKRIKIEGNEDFIDHVIKEFKNGTITNTKDVDNHFKTFWNRAGSSSGNNANASEKRKSNDRNGKIRFQQSPKPRGYSSEGNRNSQQSSEGTPNRGINTDKPRFSLKKSLQEQYHDQLADAARRIAERQAKVLSDSKKGIKARAADYLDRAEYNWADRRFYLRKWQENIEETLKNSPLMASLFDGDNLKDNVDVSALWDTVDGRIQTNRDNFVKDYWDKFYDMATDNKVTYDDLNRYLFARHAEERDAYIASINPEFASGGHGSGWDDSWGTPDEEKKRLEKKYGYQLMRDIGVAYDEMTQALVDKQLEYHLISKATADMLKNRYKHYVPLKRFDDAERHGYTNNPAETNINQKINARAYGRESQPEHMLTFAKANIDTVFRRGERNMVKLAMLNLATRLNDVNIQVDRKVVKRTLDRNGDVTYAVDRSSDAKGNTIFATKGDATFSITFHNQELYNAFISDDMTSGLLQSIVHALRGITGIMGSNATSRNIEFGLVNLAKDQQQALAENLIYRGNGKSMYDFAVSAIKNIPVAAKTFLKNSMINSSLAKKAGIKVTDDADTRMFREFLKYGGTTGYIDIYRLTDDARKLEQQMDEKTMTFLQRWKKWKDEGRLTEKAKAQAEEWIARVMAPLEFINDLFEQITRFSNYRVARQAGLSPLKAAELSKNLTINFNRHGALWTSKFNWAYMFSNASLQGTGFTIGRKLPIVKQKYKTMIGEVEIDWHSARDSLAHGYAQKKLDIITGLQEDFKKAIYLKSEKDFDGKNINNHYFAYPIEYNGKRELVFCRVREDNNKNRLYVHEVFTEDEIKKGSIHQTAASALNNKDELHRGTALYKTILKDIYKVNQNEVSKVVDENGEPLMVWHGTNEKFNEFDRVLQ